MIVRTRFDIDQIVGINALNKYPATVNFIKLEGKDIYYGLGYWDEKVLKEVTCKEFELSEEVNEVII